MPHADPEEKRAYMRAWKRKRRRDDPLWREVQNAKHRAWRRTAHGKATHSAARNRWLKAHPLYHAEWKRQHPPSPEQIAHRKQAKRLYYDKHRQERLQKNREWYEANRDTYLPKVRERYAIRATGKADYAKRKDYLLANTKAWRRKNREKYRLYVRAYRRWNLEHLREKEKERRWRDPEATRARERARLRNPEAKRNYANRRRARKQAARGQCSREKWLARVQYYGWRCWMCHNPLTSETLTMDHVIPLSRGGSHWPANLRPACKGCNCSKGIGRGRR